MLLIMININNIHCFFVCLKIYRPENINTNQSNTFKHIHDENVYKRDTAKLFNQKEVNDHNH